MATYTTPGVYVEEISTLPASIAPVATAIPAFIGYTKQRKENGVDFAVNTPKRITSLLEFEQMFGTTLNEAFTVSLTDPPAGSTDNATLTLNNPSSWSPYLLYYQVKMYFGNGGGPCWIVSVGNITPGGTLDATELENGLKSCEKEDEITLLVIPEIVKLGTSASRRQLNDAMLVQCNKLQDRFAVIDTLEGSASDSISTVAGNFRNNEVSLANLKYGAAYFPSLQTTINYLYDVSEIAIADTRTAPANIYNTKKVSYLNGTYIPAEGTISVGTNPTANKTLTINGTVFTFKAGDNTGSNIEIGANEGATATKIAEKINTHAATKDILTATRVGTTVELDAKGTMNGPAGNNITLVSNDAGVTVPAKLSGGKDLSDLALYNKIIALLKEKTLTLYPSAAMCGVYASVDRNRGVWKAPANYSLAMVNKPNVDITDDEQGLLNVDATSGKSINAIRTFTGKGVLVWGARTLAGNDNEWRYVPVRRLYIFVEESIKKSTEFVVFEPNDANTWVKVKGSITNFLTGLWRDGALAGAKPEDAFFVNIGLGVTMTSLDILEGRMNIEIGMAAVRPAEFIILKFSHLLAKS